MAHQSLYRRYRPQRFSEIRGQQHVRQALQTAVREGRWSHAYLFSGPRGTGKTTTARVLAKALNCQDLGPDGEPCGVCESCTAIEQGRSFDLHELDAASHNKVDDIRDLISKVHLGSPGRTKVYILDEVHMLTAGAENALLKTLEEPPDHVVFVLATTEPHKVVPTIRSRTQHFEFQLLPGDELAEHVRWVIADAGLDVDDDAIDYVLRSGGGSARDTLSALDLVSAAGGVPAGSAVGVELARAIGQGDTAGAIAAVQRALETGREPRTIAEETLAHLRDAFLATMGAGLSHLSDAQAEQARESAGAMTAATLTRALESLGAAVVEMRQSPDPRIPLEVCLLRLTRRAGTDPAALLQRIEALEIEVAALRSGGATPGGTAAGPADGAGSVGGAAAGQAPGADGPAETPVTDTAAAREARSSDDRPTTDVAGRSSADPGGPPGDAGRAARSTADDARPAPAEATPPAADTGGGGPRPVEAGRPGGTGGAPPPPPRRTRPADAARRNLGDREQERPAAPAAARPERRPPARTGPPRRPPADHASSPPDAPPAAAAPEPTPAAPAGPAPTLAAVEAAWAETVLDALSNRARARYKVGRFLALDGGTARFALPNPIHRDRCAELLSEVEAALAAAVGQAVRLQLEVAADAGDPGRDQWTPRPARRDDEHDDHDDVGDITELANADDVASSGIERLTRAFPGSEVITHDD